MNATVIAPPGDRAESRPPAGFRLLTDLARSAAGPLVCAAILIGLLSAWVAVGGAGTLTRVRLQVTLAAVPQRAFTQAKADTIHTAGTYLTIKNISGTGDELIAVRSPIAARVMLVTRATLGGTQTAATALAIPAHGTLTLTPLTDDVVLEDPVPFEVRTSVPLTLVFRHAGQITIDAQVTGPGTP